MSSFHEVLRKISIHHKYFKKGLTMIKNRLLHTLSISVLTATILVACGSNGNGNGQGKQGGQDNGSNIPYLKENHANYKEHGSDLVPKPTKDAAKKSIDWTISASTEEGAIKLQEHLSFMEDKLNKDKNPRGWDKLFLMEAYMKFNKHYITSVERTGTNVVVSKVAKTDCAYEVISAHSDAVSGDFFAQGAIENDYSSIAEGILASNACTDVRTSVESYIIDRQKSKKN